VKRIAAIDWMRGIVMVLMAIDHASVFFNDGRVAEDSAAMYVAGSALPPVQFFTRWITHLCAPTFVFLAGTAIAVSAARRRERGMSEWSVDKDLLVRGAFIALLDLLVMSNMAGTTLLQVLYAIGVSMMLMVPLRRLGPRALFVLGLAVLAGSEALTAALWDPGTGTPSLALSLTLVPQRSEGLVILYPFVPWLAMMMLGWAFGERLLDEKRAWPSERVLVVSGLCALALFALVRGLDGYGNMFLHREDASLVQWLHVSKYPPALAFAALELGLMALVLAALMRLEPRVTVEKNGPILVFGQTALFFYLAHFGLLAASRGFVPGEGLGLTYLMAAAVLVVLYPVCRAYRALKQRYPRSLLRFV
jgi:uncharacterized membrane protein